jgi:NADPH:quinone reductase-like Zn-dependent oxidoreductase
VRVKASCINIDDLHMAEGTFFGGLYPSRASISMPSIPGVDVAGTVEKLGPGVMGFAAGDAVFGYMMPKPGHGAWAEYACIAARTALKKPATYSFEEAAACGIGGKTAACAVASSGLAAGHTAVVVGAAGGIGSIIVQVLHARGVHVIGVCSGRNAALAGSLGAETVVDYTRGPYGEQLRDTRVDVVIDCVGGRDTENQALLILKKSGRFVTLVGPDKYVGEARTGKRGVMRMLWYVGRRALGSCMNGPRYIMAGIGSSLVPLQQLVLDNGIKPPIDRVLPFTVDAVRQGIQYIASHRAQGKVVIVM